MSTLFLLIFVRTQFREIWGVVFRGYSFRDFGKGVGGGVGRWQLSLISWLCLLQFQYCYIFQLSNLPLAPCTTLHAVAKKDLFWSDSFNWEQLLARLESPLLNCFIFFEFIFSYIHPTLFKTDSISFSYHEHREIKHDWKFIKCIKYELDSKRTFLTGNSQQRVMKCICIHSLVQPSSEMKNKQKISTMMRVSLS